MFIRRLKGRAPSTMVITNKSSPNMPIMTIGDGRPTGPHHATDQPSRTQHRPGFSSHPARSAQTRCIHPASALLKSINGRTVSTHAGGHGGPPLRRGFVSKRGISEAVNRVSISSITTDAIQHYSATPGGMWSGCAGSRTCQPPGVGSKCSFGGCQGGHRPRWSSPTNRHQTGPS